MKNTQRQLQLSVSQPPRAGPTIGPIMTPTPQTAIADPCFSGGLISNSTACDRGTSAAPHNPWSKRASTICASDPAIPQSTEASVNPAMENRNTCFIPKRSVSHPDSGVAMPAATMYEVSTQVIWSWEAERLPCMCGSATLAIVPSIAWITVASMIDTVIMRRSTAGLDSLLAATAPAEFIPLEVYTALCTLPSLSPRTIPHALG